MNNDTFISSQSSIRSGYIPIAALIGKDTFAFSCERRAWTCPEEKVLREFYPIGGVRECLGRLPGRTINAIRSHAREIGLKAPCYRPTQGRQKFESNDVIDEVIRRGFARQEPGFMIRIARQVGRSEPWIKRRAVELGVVVVPLRPKEWSPMEDHLLAQGAEEGMEIGGLRQLLKRHGFARSPLAIRSRLFRIDVKLDRDCETTGKYTVQQLAVLFGIDWRTAKQWILRFGLPSAQGKPGSPCLVRRQDLRRWIMDNLALINFHTVDKFWFATLLYGKAE